MPSFISWRFRVSGVPSGKRVEWRSAEEYRWPLRTTTRSPSASHSRIDPVARPSRRRTSAGTETCPCEVNRDCASFMGSHYHGKDRGASSVKSLSPADRGRSRSELEGHRELAAEVAHHSVDQGAAAEPEAESPSSNVNSANSLTQGCRSTERLHRLRSITKRQMPGSLRRARLMVV